MSEHFDILIVGAGLSGIGAGCHFTMKCPDRSFALLEARETIGGTWDLFRYPGIRSDSDMYTLGYSFRPWREAKAIADGPAILKYVKDTAAEYGVDKHIRFRHRVRHAAWHSDVALWHVETETPDGIAHFTCQFLMTCSGYYAYAAGHTPDFAGREDFRGAIIHPQHWPEQLDYGNKRVIVIGSGATAVTLVPAMAQMAARVTMLQRSPTYIVSRPAEDALANWMRRQLPAKLAYGITRWRNVMLQLFFFKLARSRPAKIKAKLLELVRAELGPDYDIDTHFTPRYNPWDQRLCLVPDSDLFAAIRAGRADVVTGTIERFTPVGLRLTDGRELDADIVVTATGLDMRMLDGMTVAVDGVPVAFGETLNYKGMMYSGVPNMATVFGYTNASWTLKADLTCEYVARLLNFMRRRGYAAATPIRAAGVQEVPFLDFTSGYVQRALAQLPKQGDRRPWKLHQNYARDMVTLRLGKIDDGTLRFDRAPHRASTRAAAA